MVGMLGRWWADVDWFGRDLVVLGRQSMLPSVGFLLWDLIVWSSLVVHGQVSDVHYSNTKYGLLIPIAQYQ